MNNGNLTASFYLIFLSFLKFHYFSAGTFDLVQLSLGVAYGCYGAVDYICATSSLFFVVKMRSVTARLTSDGDVTFPRNTFCALIVRGVTSNVLPRTMLRILRSGIDLEME
jgi:hypothetical protein